MGSTPIPRINPQYRFTAFFFKLILLCLHPVRGPDNFLKIPAHDPPPLPKGTGQGGCPPKLLPPPSPRFSFFVNGPPPLLSGKNEGITPHASRPKRCVSRGASGERGRGPHPSGKEMGGWGDRMKGWGYPPPLKNNGYPLPTPSRIFLPAPLPPAAITLGRTGRSPGEPRYLNQFPSLPVKTGRDLIGSCRDTLPYDTGKKTPHTQYNLPCRHPARDGVFRACKPRRLRGDVRDR